MKTDAQKPTDWVSRGSRAAVPSVASRGRAEGGPGLEEATARAVARWLHWPGRPLLGVRPVRPDSRFPQWGLQFGFLDPSPLGYTQNPAGN